MFKKNILILFIALFHFSIVFAQNANDTINRIDKNTGKKYGYWIKKYPDGKIKYQGRFENDKPDGEFKYYYEDGKIKAISVFKNKGARSFTKTFYPNGKLMSVGYYLNEKKDSLWKYYNEYDVVLREEFYKNTLKHGEWKTFYPDGTLTDKMTYKNGFREGVWEQYYVGGTLKTQFKNDKLEGAYTVYFPTGKLKYQGKYKNNKKDGIWFWFDSNALPIKRFTYKDDVLKTKEFVYYENKKPINIKFDSIAYIFVKSSVVYLKKMDGKQVQLTEKFVFITDVLGEDNFLLINKNFYANMLTIKSITPFEEKFFKVNILPKPEFEVISEEESSKALSAMFNDFKFKKE